MNLLLFQHDHIQLVPLTHLSMDRSAHLLRKDNEYNVMLLKLGYHVMLVKIVL
jgi:hypothetical protein